MSRFASRDRQAGKPHYDSPLLRCSGGRTDSGHQSTKDWGFGQIAITTPVSRPPPTSLRFGLPGIATACLYGWLRETSSVRVGYIRALACDSGVDREPKYEPAAAERSRPSTSPGADLSVPKDRKLRAVRYVRGEFVTA
jgi:hypothetical protein